MLPKKLTGLFAAALFAIFFLQLALSIRHQSQTYDEGFHLVAGYRYWQCGDFGINSEHPPLVKFVAAAPLWLGHAPAPSGDCGHEPTDKGYGYGLGINYLYGHRVDADALLFRARLAASISALLLAAGCFLLARSMLGDIAGLIALLLLAFEPSVLAHGALITTDAALSAFTMLTVLAFYRYHRSRAIGWLLGTGLLTGLTLASKHSGVLIIPILVLLATIDLVYAQRDSDSGVRSERWAVRIRRSTAEMAAILAIGVCVLWCFYGLRFAARPGNQPMSRSLTDFIVTAQEEGTHGIVLTQVIPRLARWHLLPQAYLYGFVDVLNVSNPGQPPYILGKLYPHGRWFYFPVVFIVKSTLGFLILFLIALSFALARWHERGQSKRYLYLIAPPVVFLAVATQSGLNIGYRHVLPIVGFLCVLIAGAASSLVLRNRAWSTIAVVVLLIAHIASSLHAYPNYLPYSNELWGGPSRTYRILTDANVDWGQGLYQTRDYLARHAIRDCWIAYDGAAKPSYYGIPCREITPNADSPTNVTPLSAEGTFVLSDLTISGIEWEPGKLNPYLVFQKTKPVDVIAGAMLVYRGAFDLSGVAAVTHIARSNNPRDSKPADALTEAQAAVELTPGSVRAHLALGRALATLARKAEARQQFETALSLAHETGDAWYPIQLADIRRELRKLGQ